MISNRVKLLYLLLVAVFIFVFVKFHGSLIPLRSDLIIFKASSILQPFGRFGTAKVSPGESAFVNRGYCNMSLMEVMDDMRPLFNFTISPHTSVCEDAAIGNTAGSNIMWSMVVMVKSHVEHEEKRETTRQTWASLEQLRGVRIRTVFIVDKSENPTTEAALLKESEKYGDLLQVDMSIPYNSIGLKTLAGMQWAGERCPPHWMYASADDDMMPDFLGLIESIEKMMEVEAVRSTYHSTWADIKKLAKVPAKILTNLPIHCGFRHWPDEKPIRGNYKWSVDEVTYSLPYYPLFCHGGWYTMPVKLASGVFNVSRQHKLFSLDDVWITGLLRLRYFNSYRDQYFGLNKTDRHIGIWSNTKEFVVHSGDKNTLMKRWELLKAKIAAAE